MRKFLTMLLFLPLLFPTAALAENDTTDTKIVTINRMAGDPAHQQNNCSPVDNVCSYTLYHYEIDESGKLYFVKVAAYGEKDSSMMQPGETTSILICQLNDQLACEVPEVRNLPFDLSAYTITEDGVTVHRLNHPWENPQKAALFLGQIKANTDEAIKSSEHKQSQMMDELVCYVFDFDALVQEYKNNGRLVSDRSVDRLKPEACLVSFRKICRDPDSRANEVDLAANANASDHNMFKKANISPKDIAKFCRSLEETQAAMLR